MCHDHRIPETKREYAAISSSSGKENEVSIRSYLRARVMRAHWCLGSPKQKIWETCLFWVILLKDLRILILQLWKFGCKRHLGAEDDRCIHVFCRKIQRRGNIARACLCAAIELHGPGAESFTRLSMCHQKPGKRLHFLWETRPICNLFLAPGAQQGVPECFTEGIIVAQAADPDPLNLPSCTVRGT